MSHLTLAKTVATLAAFCNRDDAGRHFTEVYSDDVIAELESRGLIAIDRPVHEIGSEYSESYWTAEVTPAGVELVEAHPEYHPDAIQNAVVSQAKKDAAAFVWEFGVPLDPANTDWDATAWGEVRIEGAADLWDLYQETLVAETERRVKAVMASRKWGLYGTADVVYLIMPSGRAWIVISPDRETVEEIEPKDIPANAIPCDDVAGPDAFGLYAAVKEASGETIGTGLN